MWLSNSANNLGWMTRPTASMHKSTQNLVSNRTGQAVRRQHRTSVLACIQSATNAVMCWEYLCCNQHHFHARPHQKSQLANCDSKQLQKIWSLTISLHSLLASMSRMYLEQCRLLVCAATRTWCEFLLAIAFSRPSTAAGQHNQKLISLRY